MANISRVKVQSRRATKSYRKTYRGSTHRRTVTWLEREGPDYAWHARSQDFGTAKEAHDFMRGLKKKVAVNPAFRRVSQSTGWIKATAVRFIKKPGKAVQVLVRKARTKKAAKRSKKRR